MSQTKANELVRDKLELIEIMRISRSVGRRRNRECQSKFVPTKSRLSVIFIFSAPTASLSTSSIDGLFSLQEKVFEERIKTQIVYRV